MERLYGQRMILSQAANVGEIMARTIGYEKRFANARVWPTLQWELSFVDAINVRQGYVCHVSAYIKSVAPELSGATLFWWAIQESNL